MAFPTAERKPARGDIYFGLWYPIAIAAMSLVIGMLFVKDTLGTDLHAKT
jgi:hypothetical protein